MSRNVLSATMLLVAICALGCGPRGEFDTAPLHGTVTFEGQPVTEGTIDIIPVPGSEAKMTGKPSAAAIGEDGAYQAGTYGDGDGVVPGVKRIRYSAPLPADTRDAAQAAPSPYMGMEIEPSEIEVRAGDNAIDFVLKKPKKK